MIPSLKKWCDTEIQIKPFEKMNGSGDKSFGDQITAMVYLEKKITTVVNAYGEVVTSTIQLYPAEAITVSHADHIIIAGVEYGVKAVEPFSRLGTIDLIVIYL